MPSQRTPPLPRPSRLKLGLLVAAALLVSARGLSQPAARLLPFQPGESCVYTGSGPLGRMGSGTFAVERAAGQEWLLRFDFRGRVGIIGVENHSRSWFDPAETASFRFSKTERSPLSSGSQQVEMDRAAGRWSGVGEAGGPLASRAPLDELSFIYFLRTLRTGDGASYELTRHYDLARNPVRIRVLGRGPLRVPAGEFSTVELEMRVRDPRRYGGEGVIRIHLTDDARRLPVRIDSRIPRAGHMVLALEAITPTCGAVSSSARPTD